MALPTSIKYMCSVRAELNMLKPNILQPMLSAWLAMTAFTNGASDILLQCTVNTPPTAGAMHAL